jgi:hypothetical protein
MSKMKEIIMKAKHEKELLEKEVQHERELRKKEMEQNEMLRKDKEYYKSIINVAGQVVQKTMSAFSYVTQYYPNAPSMTGLTIKDFKRGIKMIEDSKSDGDVLEDDFIIEDASEEISEEEKKNDDDLIEEIFHQYRNGDAVKYIGDAIVILCKKDKDEDQFIWNSDKVRLTYIIKRALYDGESRWHIDKEGIDTKKMIVEPILKELRVIIVKYKDRKCVGGEEDDIGRQLRIEKTSLEMINEIDSGLLHKKILKYMAPEFYCKRKDTKQIKN